MSDLTESLPALQRLALSYAPAHARGATLALLALDARLAGIVRGSSEPMLAQIRLAWWREILAQEQEARVQGEPLVGLLDHWQGVARRLVALVDGWECLVAGTELDEDAAEAFARGRGEGFAALADVLGLGEAAGAARRMGQDWALCDLANRLGNPEEAQCVRTLLSGRNWRSDRLPRGLRSLVVLHGLAARSVRRGEQLDDLSARALLPAMRLGLFGF